MEPPSPRSLVQPVHKCTPVQALSLCTGRKAHKGSRGVALIFLDHGTRTGEWSASRPGRSLPPGKTRYPLYRRLGGPQGRSGQVRKISPPPGFDPRTVQPVASRYTDWATRQPVYRWISIPNVILAPNTFKLHLKLRIIWMIKWKKCFEKLTTFRMSVMSTYLMQYQTDIHHPAMFFRCCYSLCVELCGPRVEFL